MSSQRLRKNYVEASKRLRNAITEANDLVAADENTVSSKRLVTTLNVLSTYARRVEEIMKSIMDLNDLPIEEKEENENLTEDNIFLMLDFDEISEKLKVNITFSEKETLQKGTERNDQTDSIQVSPLNFTLHASTSNTTSMKLPKLSLPSFNGNVLKWQEFWDPFESAVHSNQSLSEVDKFNYLNSLLTDEAKLCIAGVPLTSLNYGTAVSMLKDRFANSHIIINSHYKALMDLNPVRTSGNEISKLQNLFYNIEKHLRCLQNLGEDINSNFFLSLIMRKLPQDIIIKVEEQNVNNSLDVKMLCTLVKNMIQAREKSQLLLSATSFKSSNTGYGSDPQHSDRSTLSTTQALPSYEEQTSLQSCIFCKENHWSDQCQKYFTVEERKGKIKGLCFICLRGGHNLHNCKVNKPCVYCKQRTNHHRSLCPKRFPQNTRSNETSSTNSSFSKEPSLISANENAILQTAKVYIMNDDLTKPARVLFDTGSQRSYISKDLALKLKLECNDTQFLSVFTFGNTEAKTIETQTVTAGIKLLDGNLLKMNCNVVPKITGKLHACRNIDVSRIKKLYPSLVFAENQNEDSEVDLLIGNDYYLDIITNERIELKSGLYLIGSKVGWIVSGRENVHDKIDNIYSSSFLTTIEPTNLFEMKKYFERSDSQTVNDFNVKDLWSLESLGIHDCPYQNDDDIALCEFNKTVKLENGRYSVSWPWKEYPPHLPSNYGLSLGRLKSLMNRFKDKPNLLKQYDSVINDQVSSGIIEKVPINDDSTVTHYIPHHPVINETKTTTKLRIVYDASAKSKRAANSLNDCLYRGPVILEDLCGLLLRFQLNAVALIADIEKAFLQLQLHEPDKNVTRFLWVKDTSLPVEQSNIEEFRFCRVPFGVISSPFLLSATIKYHLSKSNPTAESENLKHSFYVDNVVTGVTDENEAYKLFNSANHLFSQAGMNLQGWCSNSKSLMDTIPPCKMTKEDLSKVNVLGLRWDTVHDNLSIKPIHMEATKCTKRSVLQLVSSVFEPTGVCNPCVLKAKLFIQKLWEENFDWDEQLSEKMCDEWENIRRDLLEICKLVIPRYIGLKLTSIEVHCFSDASSSCYSTTIYVRVVDEGIVKSKLMFSKTHLAPSKKKSITMPRLELLGVLIGTRSLNFVVNNLKLPISKKVLWTDSLCDLHWFRLPEDEWPEWKCNPPEPTEENGTEGVVVLSDTFINFYVLWECG